MKQSSISRVTGGFLITLAGAVLFSTKAIFVKLAYWQTDTDPVSLLMLRMLFSIPFYLFAIWWTKRKQPLQISRQQWMAVLALGLLGYYLSSLFDFMGLRFISAGLERLILFLYPTFALLINLIWFRQPVTRVQKIALALTYTGILLAFFSELRIDGNGRDIWWGSFLVFLCAVFYSIYIVGTGRLVRQMDVTLFTSVAMLAAAGGVVVHFLIAGDYQALRPNPVLWSYGVLLALVATVIPSFMLSEGMKRLGSNNVALILAVGPVSTILQAWLFLGEHIGWLQVLGSLLVIAGVVLIGWKKGAYGE